jgi:CheY-like chemotaxis protein
MYEKPRKLLIVDENVSVRSSLSSIFSALGYQVQSCEDGLSAFAEISMEIPDVLLSDINMMRMPGLEFLMAVRCRFPSIRVIATGGAWPGNRMPFGVAADVTTQKDAGPNLLLAAVDAMTQSRRPTSRLSMDDLFGFRVFESIPPHPGAGGLAFPANRTLVFPILVNERHREVIPWAGVAVIPDVSS